MFNNLRIKIFSGYFKKLLVRALNKKEKIIFFSKLKFYFKFILSINLKNSKISCLFLWDGILARVDLLDDVMRMLTIDLASDGLSGTQDLLDGASQILGHRSGSHLARDLDDLVERDAAVVLDVLHLLLVAWRLLQSLDNQR